MSGRENRIVAKRLLNACPCADGCPCCTGAAGVGAKHTLLMILNRLTEE